MTGPDSQDTRPISVAELLARNGTIGAPPVGGRRRRRRGNTDAVSVAELTGEIPIIRPDDEPADEAHGADETVAELQSHEFADAPADTEVPAEEMVPDPVDMDDTGTEIHLEDTEFAVAGEHVDEFDEPPSYLHAVREPLFGGRFDDELRRDDPVFDGDVASLPNVPLQTTTAEDHEDDHEQRKAPSRMGQIGRGLLIVLQSMLAVALGAGLFIAFDELWKWNKIVALVLSVLVILGLVVGVRIVRKTEDIGSTLIAVAVGALVTLGPLALLQSG